MSVSDQKADTTLEMLPLDPMIYSQRRPEDTVKESSVSKERQHFNGWRLHSLTVCLCLSVFLPNLETTIVSSTLTKISSELRAFELGGWIMVSYLGTYTGSIIVWAKLSDIIGRKAALVVTLAIFIIFSGGCGAARTIDQMIILRALQGLGGSGCFSVATVTVFEMVPKRKYPLYAGLVAAIVALAALTGPVCGGAIMQISNWRWVFWLNLPIGFLTLGGILIVLPGPHPYHTASSKVESSNKNFLSKAKRLDLVGTILFLGACFTFVTALLETSTKFQWSSATTIALLTISGVLAMAFLVWERYITLHDVPQEPLFPWRFVRNRAWIAMLCTSCLLGLPFAVLVVTIPQKLQTISNVSPLTAGVRLLPYALFAPFGSVSGNVIISRRRNVAPVYIVITGSCIQLLGLSLLFVFGHTGSMHARQYGCQMIAGFGLGLMFGPLTVMTPLSVDAQDLATATGAIVQFRQFGSTIGLSIATSVLNAKLKSGLPSILGPSGTEVLLQNIELIHTLPELRQDAVQTVFLAAYSFQYRILIGFAVVNVIATLFIWKRKQILIPS